MNLTKRELREVLKLRRRQLSEVERAEKSVAIQLRLNSVIDWSKIKSLHCFEPITALGEVTIAVPPGVNSFTSRKIDDVWQVVSSNPSIAVPDQFDAAVVPMLGFDINLHRIGYGGGYYDKLLAKQVSAVKIGVCFESGLVSGLPIEDHDIPMDFIITEDKVRS